MERLTISGSDSQIFGGAGEGGVELGFLREDGARNNG